MTSSRGHAQITRRLGSLLNHQNDLPSKFIVNGTQPMPSQHDVKASCDVTDHVTQLGARPETQSRLYALAHGQLDSLTVRTAGLQRFSEKRCL